MRAGNVSGWLVSSVLLVALAASTAWAQPVRLIARKALPSVVLLVMQDAEGRPISIGTGFFVGDDVLATNLHLLDGASHGYYKHVGYKKKFPIAGIAAKDEKRDLVLLAVPESTGPPLALGDSAKSAVGDVIYAVGNPHGLEGTFSQGIISGIRQVGSHTFLQITAPVSVGSSGSPVINAKGEVIGIVTATEETGQNLNFALPASYLRELLSRKKSATPLAAYGTSVEKRPATAALPTDKEEQTLSGTHFRWDRWGPMSRYYSFSIRNQSPKAVKGIYYLVEFYDRNGEPVHVEAERYDDIIPPGLAKRVNGSIDVYLADIVDKVQIRVVRYETVE